MKRDRRVKEHLASLLDVFPSYDLSNEDQRVIEGGDKVDWVTQKILRKKFRKTRIYKETEDDIRRKVSLSIKEEKPLYFIILFGGYKHFWNPAYPEVDWAEFFNLNFMTEYLSPLLKIHQPGVVLDYGSEDVIMTMMDNYPPKDLDAYAESFEKMIKFCARSFPENYQVNYVRTGEKYDSRKLKEKIKRRLPEKKKAWEKLPDQEKEKVLRRSQRSIMWCGEEDWSSLSEVAKAVKIVESKIIEDTFYEVEEEFLGDYFTGDNHIPIVLSWGLSDENIFHWLTLGSTYSSCVDFWIGRGVLEDRGSRFVPRVVSKEQYQQIKDRLETVELSFLPLRNFRNIEVFPGVLNF
jgi:hypothetical protein